MVHLYSKFIKPLLTSDTQGSLPYLTHGLASITSFFGISKYIATLRANSSPDDREEGFLTPKQRAQQAAWLAYVEAHLGDLVVRTKLVV